MKIALIGYGKMGKEIEQILISRGHTVTLIIDIDNAGDLNAENLRKADVAIEFTTPHTAFQNIVTCLEAGVPVVCGTTGWLDRYAEVEKLCNERKGTFFYASNYSVGVNVFFAVNRRLAELMERFPEYDVTVEETHHTQKKGCSERNGDHAGRRNSREPDPQKEMDMRYDDRARRVGDHLRTPQRRSRDSYRYLRVGCRPDRHYAQCQEPQRIGYRSRARRRIHLRQAGYFHHEGSNGNRLTGRL